MESNSGIKHEIRESALHLLQFTTEICNERRRPGLIAFFKDDIINLTEDDKMLCSLLRLYNTFKSFEPEVLIKLNEFLPQNLRYLVTEKRNDTGIYYKIELSPQLIEHQNTCTRPHVIPEEDQFEIYLMNLSELVDAQTASEFKQLLTKFVNGSSEERVEVLQFILRSAELLGSFPELLAGLLEYLNRQWYQYAMQQLSFQNLEQIALAYGVFSENARPIDLFKAVVLAYKKKELTPQAIEWRDRVIFEISQQVKRVSSVSQSLMQEFQAPRPQPPPPQRETKKQEHEEAQSKELKALISVLSEPLNEPENPRTIAEMTQNLQEFYDKKRWRETNITFGVPVQREVVSRLFELYDVNKLSIYLTTHSFLSSIVEKAFIHILEEHTQKNCLHIDEYQELVELAEFQEFCRMILEKKPNLNFLQFKFACVEKLNEEQLNTLEEYKGIYSTQNLVHDALFCNSEKANCYNSTIYHPILPFDEKKAELFYYECDVPPIEHFTGFEKAFYNMTLVQKSSYCKLIGVSTDNNTAKDCYAFKHPVNSGIIDKSDDIITSTKPEQHIKREYGGNESAPQEYGGAISSNNSNLTSNAAATPTVQSSASSILHFSRNSAFQLLNSSPTPIIKPDNMVIPQLPCEDDMESDASSKICKSAQIPAPASQSNPKAQASPRPQASVLNKDVYSAFANGYEAASAKSLNPYLIHELEIETDKVFFEYEEPAALEEHMMKYDIFLNNLKLIKQKLAGYCASACPMLTDLVVNEIQDEEVLKGALKKDEQLQKQPIELVMPETCLILLKSSLGDDYFDELFMYTKVAAPFALRRIDSLYTEVQKHRNLIISPTFTRRLRSCYFRSLDFQGKQFLEWDKKVLGGKIFFQELEEKKQTVNLLKADNFKLLDASLKPVYPWDLELYGLPLSYYNWPKTEMEKFESVKSVLTQFKLAGCKSLWHSSFPDDKPPEMSPSLREHLKEFLCCFSIPNKQSQKQHFCSDFHSIMLRMGEISHKAYKLAEKILQVNKLVILKPFLDAIEYNNVLLLDSNGYLLIRLLIVFLDRLSFLLQTIDTSNYSENYKQEVDGSPFEQRENTSYQQNVDRLNIFRGIEDLTQPEIVIKPSEQLRGEELLEFYLVNDAPEENFFSAFGMRAYSALGIKNIVKEIKKVAEEIQDAAVKVSGVIIEQSQGFSMNLESLSGFLVHYELEREISLIEKYIVVENILRSVPSAEIIVYEKIDGWVGFSEVDL